MNRNVTAVYRTHATADLVRGELLELGISYADVHIIPEHAVSLEQDSDRDDIDRYMDDLHALHLPENDVRTYQQCVRRGDFILSVNVDEDKVPPVKQVMRRPEDKAHNPRFSDAGARPYSSIGSNFPDEDGLARPGDADKDPHLQSYRRDVSINR